MSAIGTLLLVGGGLYVVSKMTKKKTSRGSGIVYPEPATPYPKPGHVGIITVGPVQDVYGGPTAGVVEVSEGIARAAGSGEARIDSAFVVTGALPVRVLVALKPGVTFSPHPWEQEGFKILTQSEYDMLLELSFYSKPVDKADPNSAYDKMDAYFVSVIRDGAFSSVIRIFVVRPNAGG